MGDWPVRTERVRSSRQRYRAFVQDYKQRRLDDRIEAGEEQKRSDDSTGPGENLAAAGSTRKGSSKRREYLREYMRWLWPHRFAVAALLLFALLSAALEMISPLFMRFLIDRVLLNTSLDAASRLGRLHLIGGVFLGAIVLSTLIGALKDYRQRVLNTRVMLTLRRSLFERLLHLPLPKLWDFKTGGILSRLTGDVDTTTGLLQLAVVSPTLSVIRLIIAVVVLLTLNWRLALTALAIIPGLVLLSLVFARRVRPIYRSVRKDVERIDGRVGETFSGIRIVRAFRREVREQLDYLRGRHTVLRKELFASRREMVLWTSWGLLLGIVNVVIVWYGGYLHLSRRASIGDIMAFQWYTFLLLNPVWNIVNSFSELQRSLAAMERVFEVLAMSDDNPDKPAAREARGVVAETEYEKAEFDD